MDDGTPLVDQPPEPEQEHDHDGEDVIVYELGDWTEERRGEVTQRLIGDEIPFEWENEADLVVGEAYEARVDALLDEIEHPLELAPTPEDAVDTDGDGEADDEQVYDVISHLYVAADRLKDDPDDLALAGEFFDASDAARAIALPFGFDPDVWARVQELAREISAALEQEEPDAVVQARAKELRDILFDFV